MSKRRNHAGITRAELSAQARRRRAMAHIERLRSQRTQRAPAVRRIAGAIAGLSLVAGAVAGVSGLGARPLESVWVTGARWVSDEAIAATVGLGSETEKTLQPGTVIERLIGHAWIEEARALALPNGSLLVAVTEREPAAVLAGEEPWVVDVDGVPFAPAPERGLEGLPVLTSAVRPVPGQPDPDLARAVALARSLGELGLPAPRAVEIAAPDDPEGLTLLLPGVSPRVVLGRDDLEARLMDLARLLESEIPELEHATRIDLRFEDQAVLDVPPPPKGAAQAAAQRGGARSSNSQRAG